MKRKWLFLLFFSITLFFINKDVYAYINNTNTEIECIYGNGIVAGLNYESGTGKLSVYIKDYPVSKTSTIDGDPITNISFFNTDHAIKRLRTLTCPSSIRYWIAWEYADQTKERKTFRGIYSFDWCSNKEVDCQSNVDTPIAQALLKTQKTSWWPFAAGEVVGGYQKVYGTNLLLEGWPEAEIPLVGERLYVVDDIGDDSYSHTFKLVDNNSQAVGTPKYAQIFNKQFTYDDTPDDDPDDDVKVWGYYLQVGNTITSIEQEDWSEMNSEYVCIQESTIVEDASRGDSSKKFSGIRHQIVRSSETGECSSGYQKYIRTTETCKVSVGTNADSFCDKYTNTAYVLIDIIQIMQILVPALVIILTGIEIGRIVLAGNLEEELPKRKKSIIIRFIVMVAFLFLPIITQLIISLAEGVSILDVSCLFNNGERTETNPELNEKNCVDVLPENDSEE